MKRGSTPLSRWKLMTQELAYAMPLSPPMSEWLMTLYEHDVRTLSRKTGITYKGFNYKGDNLTYLVEKYGEVELEILLNRDDYRFIYVKDGDDRPLVQLTEEFVSDTTPAYSFDQMAARNKEEKERQAEAPEKTKFREDVHNASMQVSKKTSGKKPSRAEVNRATADRAKEAQAIRRAIQNPVKPTATSATSDTAQSTTVSFADAPALPLLNRESGKEQT